ncbi:unnamed protein product [Pleuronectes platessa]|uniref:Uncharacterized protein n=1 Tax=Pleuronectes platessa TaxID=8262 RepID=A0A9N7VXI6_PLEPL|nr:unnamed protein product [Pleuronectes platessa]
MKLDADSSSGQMLRGQNNKAPNYCKVPKSSGGSERAWQNKREKFIPGSRSRFSLKRSPAVCYKPTGSHRERERRERERDTQHNTTQQDLEEYTTSGWSGSLHPRRSPTDLLILGLGVGPRGSRHHCVQRVERQR